MEQIGHVAHLNLKSWHEPYAAVIGDVMVECLPTIETVVNKIGQVSGDFRTYDMMVVAGRNDTKVQFNEHGIRLQFDLSKVYWCSRLSGERKYMVDRVFAKNQIICDPFCGVGAQVLLAAKELNCTIIANDWNPDAVSALRKNIQRNKVESYFPTVSCQDATDFLIDVGLSETTTPHHVIMNYPLESPKFLSALRWWLIPSKPTQYDTQFHLYTFAREGNNNNHNNNNNNSTMPRRTVEQVAIDQVAHHLLPQGAQEQDSIHREQDLNALGCNVTTRIIRDVAPGKVVVYVSFTLTKRLLKHIQGDFM